MVAHGVRNNSIAASLIICWIFDGIPTSLRVALADFADSLRCKPVSLGRGTHADLSYLATTLSVDTFNTPCLQTQIKPLPLSPAGLYAPGARRTSKGGLRSLGSRLIDHSQKMTVAARATAEKKTVGHRS
jgi:hypothetical protein